MRGLWSLPTRTLDAGVGIVVYDALVAFLVIGLTMIATIRRSKDWPEARTLHIGMILMSW